MLSRTHEEFLQMSHLQQKHCQHGVAIQAPRASDRNSAYATRIPGHESLDILQRLQRKGIGQISLAGVEMSGVSDSYP